MEVQEIPDADKFIQPQTIIDLGLIQDNNNPISKVEKMEEIMIRLAFPDWGLGTDTIGFNDMGKDTMETA